MSFIETALKLERESLRIYGELAERCVTHEGIRRIVTMLADDQKKHLEFFSSNRGESCRIPDKPVVFHEAKKLFSGLKKSGQTFSCEMDQLQLYREAYSLLNKKHRLYSAMAEETECPVDREMLKRIAAEERRQAEVLDNIIQMVSRPQNWIEDAEFTHLDEY